MHRLWLDGQRAEAQDLVPVEIAHRTNLLGDDENIKVRLRAYRDAGIDSLRVGPAAATTSTRCSTTSAACST